MNRANKQLFSRLVEFFYASSVLTTLIPTVKSRVEKELRGFQTVLDLGCGSDSFVPLIGRFDQVVGVEADLASVNLARASGHYSQVYCADLCEIEFPERSFDAVVLIEVIEHMPFEEGLKLIEKAKLWTRGKLLITTPNGFWPQGALYGNDYQRHISGWNIRDLENIEMKVRGLAGFKLLRKELGDVINPGATALSYSIRWRPWQLWLTISALSQIVAYRVARTAFELIAIWERPQQ
ncbi:MAG: class I SAM-dependent methyltransferase [Ferrimicrobium sp.]